MFHALFRRREDEVTPLQSQKNLQIDRLKEAYPNVVEMVKDTDYRLTVAIDKLNITFVILLPPYFPQEKPEIQIVPAVVHPWVDEHQKITGSSSLQNFNLHSDLSKVIREITHEFQIRLPVIDLAAHAKTKVPPPPYVRPEMSSMVGTPLLAGPFGPFTPSPPSSGAGIIPTEIPRFFPELKEYTVDQLQHLNSNDDSLNEVIEKLPIIQTLDKELEKLTTTNEKLAKENITQQPRIEEGKKTLLEKVDQLMLCRKQFDDYNTRFQTLSQRFTPSSIRECLEMAATAAETESEQIAVTFLDSKMDLEEFLGRFLQKRTLYHERRVKEEKLRLQLQELQKKSY